MLQELSPIEGVKNEVSFMLNKTQARFLIRKLKQALKEDSDFCMEVMTFENILIRQPWTREEGMHMMHKVSGKLVLDNW